MRINTCTHTYIAKYVVQCKNRLISNSHVTLIIARQLSRLTARVKCSHVLWIMAAFTQIMSIKHVHVKFEVNG